MLKSRIVFIIILIVLSAACIGSCRRAGAWLVEDDVPAHADAMVLLMGSFPERVLEAVDIYHTGKAGRLIIVEESMGQYMRLEERGVNVISTTDQARDAAVILDIPIDSIKVLPGDARSTLTEAIIVRKYLAGCENIDTLLLVTSAAHTRRASMIFKAAFRESDKPVFVGSCPSAYSDFDAKHWWRNKEDVQTVLSEYVKIGSFVLFEKKKLGVN